MSGILRRATVAHAGALAVIHADAFPPRERWGADAFELQLALPGVLGLIHPDGGFLLLRVAADEAEILTLAVAQAARRRGVASALLASAMKQARAAGVARILLEVAVSNGAALALYRKAGFAEVGHRPRYYPDGGDALVLCAELQQVAIITDC